MKTDFAIKDNTFARQFEATIPEGLITIEYSLQERKIFLTKLSTPTEFDNDNTIDEILKDVLAVISENKLRVVPTYPKIAQFFKKHSEYAELLPPGIRM